MTNGGGERCERRAAPFLLTFVTIAAFRSLSSPGSGLNLPPCFRRLSVTARVSFLSSLNTPVHIISFPISSRRDRSERRKERVTGTEGNEMGERYYMRVPSVPCHSVPSSLRSSVTSFPVHTSLYLHSPTVRSGTSNE